MDAHNAAEMFERMDEVCSRNMFKMTTTLYRQIKNYFVLVEGKSVVQNWSKRRLSGYLCTALLAIYLVMETAMVSRGGHSSVML